MSRDKKEECKNVGVSCNNGFLEPVCSLIFLKHCLVPVPYRTCGTGIIYPNFWLYQQKKNSCVHFCFIEVSSDLVGVRPHNIWRIIFVLVFQPWINIQTAPLPWKPWSRNCLWTGSAISSRRSTEWSGNLAMKSSTRKSTTQVVKIYCLDAAAKFLVLFFTVSCSLYGTQRLCWSIEFFY